MLIRTISLILAVLLLLVVAMSCDSDKCVQPVPCSTACDKDRTEAELAALWLSGELVAPDSLYRRLLWGFTTMRETYGKHIAEVAIRFQFPAVPSSIVVDFSDSAAAQFIRQTYTEWDSLNNSLALTLVDTFPYFTDFPRAYLYFDGLKHPRELAEKYLALDGIIYAFPRTDCWEFSNTYPWIRDGKLTFLVSSAWGDCSGSCIHHRQWYFKEVDNDIRFAGQYDFYDLDEYPTHPMLDELWAAPRAWGCSPWLWP